MTIEQNHLEAIIASMLAVNAYGLERSYALLPGFRTAGLTDPVTIAREDVGALMMRLAKAGYDRGLLTEMMAGRMSNFMKAVANGELDELDEMVARGDQSSAVDLLCKIRGIGPKVATDSWLLMRS